MSTKKSAVINQSKSLTGEGIRGKQKFQLAGKRGNLHGIPSFSIELFSPVLIYHFRPLQSLK